MSDDLMYQDEIRDIVRTAYGAIITGAGRAMAGRFYSDEELALVPGPAVDWALGVGNPVRHAGLSVGEVVLDIGSGGGIDTVLAAQRVGSGGQVIGLDALPEMCERARAAASVAGVAGWCEYREGEMEAIPLPNESVDAVISNGVINLSPRKSRTFAEITRVLRPGGRICVSDIVVNDDLPPEVLSSGPAWAGCIAGAYPNGSSVESSAGRGWSMSRSASEAPHARRRRPLPAVHARGAVAHAPGPPPGHTPAHRHERGHPSGQARSTHPENRRPLPYASALVERLDDAGGRGRWSHGTSVEESGRGRAHREGHRIGSHHPVPLSQSRPPWHRHDRHWQLQLTERRLPLTPGDVFSIASNEPHAIANEGPGRCGWCALTASPTRRPDDRVGDLLHRRRKAIPLTGLPSL